MCICPNCFERLIELLSYKLCDLSVSLHLTPLIIAARKKRYNFPPRHYTLAPDRIPTFFYVRSDSPFNSRSSFLQLAARFPATDAYFASNLWWISYSYRDKWKERANRRGDKSRERKSISIFRSNPRSSFVRNLNSPTGHMRTVSQAFHVAFNQHLPCHSIGWQKRTRETEREREKKKRKTANDRSGPRGPTSFYVLQCEQTRQKYGEVGPRGPFSCHGHNGVEFMGPNRTTFFYNQSTISLCC